MSQIENQIQIYQFYVWIQGISPKIWRRIQVSADSSIADLHYILQAAFGWSDIHLNQFKIRGKEYGVTHIGGLQFDDDPRIVKLRDFKFRRKERFFYIYNFTDWWLHEVRFEGEVTHINRRQYPYCISGQHSAPKEECGGPLSFMELKDENHKYSTLYDSTALICKVLGEPIDDDEEEEDGEDWQYKLNELRYWLNYYLFSRKRVNKRLHDPQLFEEEFAQ